jgi:DNA-binding NtrC family response regulator
MAKILSVSYDGALLTTRQKILELRGHSVTSACGLRDALQLCDSDSPFEMFIVGHSIPHEQAEVLIEHFHAKRPVSPVIALKRFGENQVEGASLVIEPNPAELLGAVAKLSSGTGAAE